MLDTANITKGDRAEALMTSDSRPAVLALADFSSQDVMSAYRAFGLGSGYRNDGIAMPDLFLCGAQGDDSKNANPADAAAKANSAVKTAGTASKAAKMAGVDAPKVTTLPGNPGVGGLEYLPGGDTLKKATPTGIAEIPKQVVPKAADPINAALTGRGAESSTYLGNCKMPESRWASTPKMTFNTSRGNITVEIPKVDRGSTVLFYSVSTPGGQVIEAQCGNDKYHLQYSYNDLLPSFLDAGWEWKKK